jgi:thiamine biosynthesis protein ThiS
MTITLNGERTEVPSEATTVEALLKSLRYTFPLIIVKVNGTLVERASYGNARVGEGDDVETYHLVSGG